MTWCAILLKVVTYHIHVPLARARIQRKNEIVVHASFSRRRFVLDLMIGNKDGVRLGFPKLQGTDFSNFSIFFPNLPIFGHFGVLFLNFFLKNQSLFGKLRNKTKLAYSTVSFNSYVKWSCEKARLNSKILPTIMGKIAFVNVNVWRNISDLIWVNIRMV